MQNITREFWYGTILPQNDCRPQNAQAKEFTELIIKNRNDLLLTMSQEQAEILEKLESCVSEYIGLTEEAIFSYAFKLGMRMMSEAYGETFENDR